jgi:hypothetical protein
MQIFYARAVPVTSAWFSVFRLRCREIANCCAKAGVTSGFGLFSRVKLSGNAVSSDCQAAHAQAENRFPHQAVPETKTSLTGAT